MLLVWCVPARAPYLGVMSGHGTEAAFEAVIVPHRSLSARGLRIVVLALCSLSGITATMFWLLGAWPVAGFTGAEVLLAVLLLRLNALAARASEVLSLTEAGLRVVRTARKGGRTERMLPAAWLNVVLEGSPGRVPRLLLVARDVREEVGRSLGEAEKTDLAQSLRDALDRRRNPRFDNPQLAE